MELLKRKKQQTNKNIMEKRAETDATAARIQELPQHVFPKPLPEILFS